VTLQAVTESPRQLEGAFDESRFELHMRGCIPAAIEGSLVVATNRRHKTRSVFSRWHDSQAELVRLDVTPGNPGRVRVRLLATDPRWPAAAATQAQMYVSQPNHGINCTPDTLWATNLLFGAPLEVDLHTWRPRRVLRFLEPTDAAPQVTSTSHFAWSLDGRHAYFHQSLLTREHGDQPAAAAELTLFRIDAATGRERSWRILPPPDDSSPVGANFHSAFYFEEGGRGHVGLLRTGAVVGHLETHGALTDHPVIPMETSNVWIVPLDERADRLQASSLPGVAELGGYALSHLEVDASSRDGFVLYANYKQAAVGEDTHGHNLYGEPPEQVPEHYAGMIIEPFNHGKVIRYRRSGGRWSVTTFRRAYRPDRTSEGHTWLPINLQLDSTRRHLFCSFAGFRPRLLPRHVAQAYGDEVADVRGIAYVPPLLMRLDATTLEPDVDPLRRHLSYAEPVAFAVVPGDHGCDWVCTFSPELGLRIYAADDLGTMVGYGVAGELMTYRDTHFRPMPAHMVFVPR
jgi:hypothetical protein